MKNKREKYPLLKHWQVVSVMLVIYDIAAANIAYSLALWLRFDGFSHIPSQYLEPWLHFAPIYSVIVVIVFYFLRLYRSLWRFASFNEMIRLIQASISTSLLHVILITLLYRRMPVSYHVFGTVLQFVFVTGVRFFYRFVILLREARAGNRETDAVMLIWPAMPAR